MVHKKNDEISPERNPTSSLLLGCARNQWNGLPKIGKVGQVEKAVVVGL
jgi:hypothetical protein